MEKGKGNTMSEERMGEIALMYVRRKIRNDSLTLDPEKLRREIGNVAKDLSVSYDEVAQFTNNILLEAFNDVLEGIGKEKKEKRAPGF